MEHPHTHNECSICLEPTNPTTDVTLSCNHTFHHKCAIGWLMTNESCPMCRKSIGITPTKNTKKYIVLCDDPVHMLNFTDLNRIYDTIIDIVSMDENNPDRIKWDEDNTIHSIIKGGSRKKNKKIITYEIHKYKQHYTVRSIYVDYWKYPTKPRNYPKKRPSYHTKRSKIHQKR